MPRFLFIYYSLMTVGWGIFTYPTLATIAHNYQQIFASQQVMAQINQREVAEINQQVQRALEYNRQLSIGKPVLDPWLRRLYQQTPEYRAYQELLNFGPDGQMGVLTIPAIHLSVPVFHGATPQILAKGAGHLFGTSLPVGGLGSHSVLTGHTGLGTVTIFDRITELKTGDKINFSSGNYFLSYQVIGHQIISPDNISQLGISAGQDRLTLVTCYPLQVNTHRYLVFAKRVVTATDQLATLPTKRTGAFPVYTEDLGKTPKWVINLKQAISALPASIRWRTLLALPFAVITYWLPKRVIFHRSGRFG